jgi:hypothetical protein
MFGHKCFLRIGDTSDSSITSLYKNSYEIASCNYGFSQGMDASGKAQTAVRGGTISLVYPNTPPTELLKWMLDSHKYENGSIVICDDHNIPLEKIFFEDAACISMAINYSRKGSGYSSTSITLQARKISVGLTSLENDWTIE